MSGNQTGGNTGTPAYFTAADTRVTVKAKLLFAAAGLLLLYFCVTHYTLPGLIVTAVCLTGMFVSGCIFPKEQLPANTVKFKAGHFLFWTVLCITGVFCCQSLGDQAKRLHTLLPLLKTVPFYLKIVGAAVLTVISEKVTKRRLEKTVHFLGTVLLLWAFSGALKMNAALLLLAGGLTLLFYFADMWMLAENAAVTDCKEHCATYGPIQLLFCTVPAMYVFAPRSAEWVQKPVEMLAPLFAPLPFSCLIGAALGMAAVCVIFGAEQSLSNNETAFFSAVICTLILMKLNLVLPFRFAPLLPAVYILLSLPFILSSGPDTALAKYAEHVGFSPFVLHMLLSGLAAAAYLLLCGGMYLCCSAVLLCAYLLITGSALAKLNQNRFRWHVSLAVVYPVFLAVCQDFGILRLRPAVIHGILMLLLQAAGAVLDIQAAAHDRVAEHCTGTTKELFEKYYAAGKQQKLLRIGKTVILGAYIILSAVMIRNLL